MERDFVAVDIGAESGRVVAGRVTADRVDLRELHRFPTGPVALPDGLRIDLLGTHRAILDGLRRVIDSGLRPTSLGIDTWGVSFALLDETGGLVGIPRHYRDRSFEGMAEQAYALIPKADLYAATGIQELPFNSSFMLLATAKSPLFAAADAFLMLPDLLAYWLSGRATVERTNASTTQLFDPETGTWALPVVRRLGLPERLFRLPLVNPGNPVGAVLPAVAETTGLDPATAVVAVGSHDTASAVAAVPAIGTDWAYISSGTWSLVGVERVGALKTAEAMAAGMTNEVGIDGTIRLLRNVMGLWLVQECRRTWESQGGHHTYDELTRLAAESPPLAALFDPDHPALFPHGDMPSRIRRLCGEAGFPLPEDPGSVVRAALDSLALKYRYVIERLEQVGGQPIRTIHVVGGGARNGLLCQLTADACNRPVVAGPVEATALGNVLVQARTAGVVGTLEGMRDLVRRSCELSRYEPSTDREPWDAAYDRFLGII